MNSPIRRQSSLLLLSALVFQHALTARADDWPQWRGPDRTDRSKETGLLKEWPEGGPKVLWSFKDAGLGYAGVSIVGNKLFTQGARGDKEYLIAVDTDTGKELWSALVGNLYKNNWGDGPRGTPTVDGDRVYTLGGNGDLICAKTSDGSQVWKVSLIEMGGKLQNWGYTESVLVDGPNVICTPGGPNGAVAALDKMSGKVVWQSKDLTDFAQYSSVVIGHPNGQKQYIQFLEKRFVGISPADGKILWKSEFPLGRTAVIPTPVVEGNQVYVTAGYGAGCKSVKIEPGNTVTDLYENKIMKNHHGGVILVDGYIYGFNDGPGWTCQNFKTGEEVWTEREKLKKGPVTYADGMLYCLEEDTGTAVLIEASPKGWNEHGRFKMSPQSEQRSRQGRIWMHPVVAHGKLYLRDQELLFCYDIKGKLSAALSPAP